MGFFEFLFGFLWITLGWWLTPAVVIFLGMTAIIFLFRAIGFAIVLLTDKY